MDIRYMREFLRLAELLNFSRAAEQLGISQSMLSRHLQALEREVGADLMQRTRASVRLTEAGKLFATSARHIVEIADEQLLSVRAMAVARCQVLNVAFIAAAMSLDVTNAALEFHKRNASTEVRFYELSPTQQAAALRDGRLDIALLGQATPALASEFDLFDVVRVPLCAVLPVAHPLAKQSFIDLAVLSREAFISLPPDEYLGRDDYVRHHCKASGFSPRFTITAHGPGAALCAVAQSGCVSVMPSLVQALPHPGAVFVPLVQKSAFVTSQAAVRRDEKRKAVRSYLACLRRVSKREE